MLRLYLIELREGYSRWSSETDGRLGLSIDDIAELQSKYIYPSMPDYDRYLKATEDERTTYDSDPEAYAAAEEVLEEFYGRAADLFYMAEADVIDFIIKQLHHWVKDSE